MSETEPSAFSIYRPLAPESLEELAPVAEDLRATLQTYFDAQQFGARVRVASRYEISYLGSHTVKRMFPEWESGAAFERFRDDVHHDPRLRKQRPAAVAGITVPDKGKRHMLGIALSTRHLWYRGFERDKNRLLELGAQHALPAVPIRVPALLPVLLWRDGPASRMRLLNFEQRETARRLLAGRIGRLSVLDFGGIVVGGTQSLYQAAT